MNTENSSDRAPVFADCFNVHGERCENPSREDFERLVANLLSGVVRSFVIERSHDRDAHLEVGWSGGVFSIGGTEDSHERGNFAFCLFDSRNGDEAVEIEIQTVPKYCTTSSVATVIAVARTYFESGDLDRSVTWHISRVGVFVPLAEVPASELLTAGDVEDSLTRHLAR